MEEQAETKRAKILAKVRKVLDQAAGEQAVGNFAAAETFQAKADTLMMEYAIEEAEIAFAAPAGSRERPVFREYDYEASGFGDISEDLATVFNELCKTVGVMRVDWSWKKAKLIGFVHDLDYLDLLWTSIKLQMVNELSPHPIPGKSLEDNLIMLKETGLKWEDIFDQLKKAGFYPHTQNWERRIGVKYTGIYTRYCQATGRTRQYANPTVYRRSFLEGYLYRITGRLREMRQNRSSMARGHEIVLAGKEDDIKEMYYEMYPDQRPHPAECECDNCHFLKCNDEKCTRPRCVAYRRDRNKPIRASRAYRDPVVDAGAKAMGRAAAERTDLTGGRNKVGGQSELR